MRKMKLTEIKGRVLDFVTVILYNRKEDLNLVPYFSVRLDYKIILIFNNQHSKIISFPINKNVAENF